jgi:hypothetical protein
MRVIFTIESSPRETFNRSPSTEALRNHPGTDRFRAGALRQHGTTRIIPDAMPYIAPQALSPRAEPG